MELWVGCIAGALEENDYASKLRAAGFANVDIEPWRVYELEDARSFLAASGVNIDATLRLAQATQTPIIASGGLNSVEDIQAVCARLVPEGVIGAIAGRALYEGKLELKSAQAAADKAVGKA